MEIGMIRFMLDFCDTYEEFQEQMLEKIFLDNVKYFISLLLENTSPEKIELLKKIKQSGFGRSGFYLNLLWIYRWLLSEGYREFDIEVIDRFFTSLNKVGLPWFVTGCAKWGFPLTNKEGFGTDEDFWGEKVLNVYVEKFDIGSKFSEVVDLWLLYHIGLRQLFERPEKPISGTMETVLTNYMNLVNEYSELEAMFGVAIEKDLYRIYNFFKE
jgi:hypothetical protein